MRVMLCRSPKYTADVAVSVKATWEIGTAENNMTRICVMAVFTHRTWLPGCLLDRPVVRVNLEILVLVVRQPRPQPQHRPEMS